jgi:hypothetical protein
MTLDVPFEDSIPTLVFISCIFFPNLFMLLFVSGLVLFFDEVCISCKHVVVSASVWRADTRLKQPLRASAMELLEK